MKKNNKRNLQSDKNPIFNYWQALYLSFYSSRLYLDVIKKWKGLSIFYLLIAIAIAAIPYSIKVIYEFNAFYHEKMVLPISILPKLYIQEGRVVFDKPMPYFIRNKHGKVISIIDTTGKIKKIDKKHPDLAVLVTKDAIQFRPPSLIDFFGISEDPLEREVYIQSLSENDNEIFDGDDWGNSTGVRRLKYLTQFLIYPSLTLYIFSLYLMCALFFGFLGQIFAQSIFQVKLTFKQAVRLLIVSSTPQIAVFFLFFTLGWQGYGEGFFYVALVALYFSYGVISYRRNQKKLVLA